MRKQEAACLKSVGTYGGGDDLRFAERSQLHASPVSPLQHANL